MKNRSQTKYYNRAPIYMCAAITGVLMGSLFTWSYFRGPISGLFPSWSAGQLSFVFSMYNITILVFAPLTGFLMKFVKPRLIMILAAITVLVGLGVMPMLPLGDPKGAYIALLIGFGVVAAASAGFGGIGGPAAYQPWVPDRLGLLTGILFFTAGVTPILFGFLCSLIIPKFGVLISMRIIGIIVFALLMITLPWCKHPGSDVKLPEAKAAGEDLADKGREYTWKEALKTPVFWYFILYSAGARSAGVILSDLGGSIAVAFGAAALFGLVNAPANGIMSVAGGMIQDKFGVNKALLCSSFMLIVSSLLLLIGNFTGLAAFIIVAIFFGGGGFGISLVLGASATRVFFGNRDYPQIYSLVTLSIAAAALTGYIAGAIIDAMKGSYSGVFFFILLLSLFSLVMTLLLIRARKRQQ